MNSLSLIDFAAIINGQLFTSATSKQSNISEVITDSRTFFKSKNSVFFALQGPTNDAHNYVEALIGKGMQVFVVSNAESIRKDAHFVLVKDTTKALQQLAAHHRKAFNYPTIGITGSNGKTIVKEWLYDILSSHFNVVRSPKSYNSQVGVPLSVLLMGAQHDLAIFEAGISQVNEMANLAKVIAPDIGILTNIGGAHQENFTSLEQKLSEKLLLFQQCKKLIFRAENNKLSSQVEAFCKKHSIEPVSWSLSPGKANLHFAIKKEAHCSIISFETNQERLPVSIPFINESAIENACHCLATLLALNLSPKELSTKFTELQSVEMRLEIKQGINNCLLINDYYNSDLNSLGIALSVLQQQAAKEHFHKQLILSDIKQSGIPKNELYQQVNSLLVEWKIDKLLGIGPDICAHKNAFTMDAVFWENTEEFEQQFTRNDFKSSVILLKGARRFKFERISSLLQQKAHQTVLEINLNALTHNLNTFRSFLQASTKTMVMVKAFSYGSGDIEIAQILQHQNVDYLAVAVTDEGIQLRNAGISTPIVVMNPEQESFQHLIDFQLEPNIYSLELLKGFAKVATSNARHNYPIHVKIDTGMNRLGLKTQQEILELVDFVKKSREVKISSVFSHLAASDESGFDDFTQQQVELFNTHVELIANSFSYKIDKHILNSAGIERFKQYQFDMVRLGIGLYGISHTGLALDNIGTFKSVISQIKSVTPDETVGYSRKGALSKASKIAIVPVGYADGLNRKLGNGKGNAYVNGKRVPIIGNICMDMLMLDIGNSNAKDGDSVEFFGPNITITELAQQLNTIPYEVLTSISQRVKRVYVQE